MIRVPTPFETMRELINESEDKLATDQLILMLSYLVKKAGGRIEVPPPSEVYKQVKSYDLELKLIGTGLALTLIRKVVDSTGRLKPVHKQLKGEISGKSSSRQSPSTIEGTVKRTRPVRKEGRKAS